MTQTKPPKKNTTPRRRNPVARADIMRKGGAHTQPRSGQRAEQDRMLQKEVADELQQRQKKKPARQRKG
ncbi:MAG: hypothetical protein ACR2P9_03330 [Gammaproteobacteria bacterium]